ncbi:hypothetical protein Aduo_006836 [Ancylostoma duodenale]
MGIRANALFLITLICGTILVVVLSIVISLGSAKPKEVPSVMYFAMYLGDEDDEEQSPAERKNCSFYLNVNNTQDSIIAMKELNQRYRFILYDENAESTAPLKVLDAIAWLTSIKPLSGGAINQTSAIGEFAMQSTERDKLIYYFPCKYKYR